MFKRYSEYAGGTCDPLVISWPKGIKARGEVRNQYHHSTDIVPTILDICGLEMPKVYRGVEQYPLSGVSMRYTFDDGERADAEEAAVLRDARHARRSGRTAGRPSPSTRRSRARVISTRTGGSCITSTTIASESKNLAKEHPEKLQALIKAWFEEADKNLVLPLDDRTPLEHARASSVRRDEPPRDRYIYYPGTSPVPEGVAVNIRGRSYKILADVEITDPNCSGVIFAHGSRFGGHALFIKDRKLHYVYNFLGIKPEQKFVSTGADAREVHARHGVHAREGRQVRRIDRHDEAVRRTTRSSPKGRCARRSASSRCAGDGLCVGCDSGDAVSHEYTSPGTFKGGTIFAVGVSRAGATTGPTSPTSTPPSRSTSSTASVTTGASAIRGASRSRHCGASCGIGSTTPARPTSPAASSNEPRSTLGRRSSAPRPRSPGRLGGNASITGVS